jgi:hypothetical protein
MFGIVLVCFNMTVCPINERFHPTLSLQISLGGWKRESLPEERKERIG